MRLLLLNINYLRHHFFIKTMQKNIMDFEHPTFGVILMRLKCREAHVINSVTKCRYRHESRKCVYPLIVYHSRESIITLYYHTFFNDSIVLQIEETTQAFRRFFSISIEITFSFSTYITSVWKYLT